MILRYIYFGSIYFFFRRSPLSAYSLTFAKERLAAYYAAEEAALTGQSYTLGGRSLTRADLSAIRTGIQLWEGRVERLETTGRSGPRMRSVIPHG